MVNGRLHTQIHVFLRPTFLFAFVYAHAPLGFLPSASMGSVLSVSSRGSTPMSHSMSCRATN